jgi:hypothetical protein
MPNRIDVPGVFAPFDFQRSPCVASGKALAVFDIIDEYCTPTSGPSIVREMPVTRGFFVQNVRQGINGVDSVS